MAETSGEHLVFVFQLTTNFSVKDLKEPILLIANTPLNIDGEENTIIKYEKGTVNTLQNLKITNAFSLSDQKITEDVSNEKNVITNNGFILIYSANNSNNGLLTGGNIIIDKGELTYTSNLEVVDIRNLISDEILNKLPGDFQKNLISLKNGLIELKQNNKISKNVSGHENGDESAENNNNNGNNQDVNSLFKQVISEFISLTEKILNISNFKKFISFNEHNYNEVLNKLEQTDAAKKGIVQNLNTYYSKNKGMIEDVWKNVDFTGFTKYNKETVRGKNPRLQSVYEDLIYTVTKDKELTDADKDIFFKSGSYKGDNDNYQVILKRFTEYLYRFKNKSTMFRVNNDSQFETMNFLYTVINNHYTKLQNFVDSGILTDIDGGGDNQKNQFPQAINTMVRNIMKTNILTFVKIRNTQDDDKTYNQRMDIQVEREKPKHLLLQYNDDNLPYYKKVDGGRFISDIDVSKHGNKFEKSGNGFKVKKYDKKYLFGEFTQVFTPELTNNEIAKRMNIIKDNLTSENPKPVFLMGYGASGAGKTSTLIYYNTKKTDGVLIELCNQIGSTYPNMEVQYREFYDSDMCEQDNNCEKKDSGKGKTFTEKPVGVNETAMFTFNSDEKKYKLSEKFDHKIHHQFRIEKLKGETVQDENTFPEGTTLGEVLIYLIDTDRHVKATTNNPNSSRSHSLILVKFSNEQGKIANLIVGDFAGVENEFDCNNPKVKEEFMDILSDKLDKDGNSQRFYKAEHKDDLLDPIGPYKVVEGQNGGTKEQDDQLPLIKPDNLGNSFKESKQAWIADGYDILNKFNENTFSIFANLFIKENNKEYFTLESKEYKKLLHSFYNYKFANSKPYSNSTEDIQLDYTTDEIKAFLNAFEKYKTYSTDAEIIKKKQSDYKAFENVLIDDNPNLIDKIDQSYQKKNTFSTFKPYFTKFNEVINNMQGYNKLEKKKLKKQVYMFALEKLKIVPLDAKTNIHYTFDKLADQNKRDENITINQIRIDNNKFPEVDDNNKTISAIKYFLSKTIGDSPGDAGETPEHEVFDTYNKINESAQILLKELGVKKEYDSYLKTIGSIGNDTISYENPDSEKKLTEELGINIESENNGIIGFMDSHVFDKSDAAADKDEEKEGEGDDNKAEAQQKEGDAAPNKAEEKENNSRARNLKVFIDNMINSRNRNLKIGNIVCAHRRTEGYFINDSLKKIRGVIRDLLYEKNKDALGVVPNYIDICFDKYCPTHENCFAFDNEISKPIEDGKIDSVIFQQIYEYLFGQDNSYSIQQMYNDILVGINIALLMKIVLHLIMKYQNQLRMEK